MRIENWELNSEFWFRKLEIRKGSLRKDKKKTAPKKRRRSGSCMIEIARKWFLQQWQLNPKLISHQPREACINSSEQIDMMNLNLMTHLPPPCDCNLLLVRSSWYFIFTHITTNSSVLYLLIASNLTFVRNLLFLYN